MLIKTIDEATRIFTDLKENTTITNFEKKISRIADPDTIRINVGKETSNLKIIYPAMRQYLKLAGGRSAIPTWNLSNEFKDPKMISTGMELLNMRISKTGGFSQVHVHDNIVRGVTSPNYQKVHTLDLMNAMNSSLGSSTFQRGFHSENRDLLSYKIGDFMDNLNEKWDICLQLENNEFGRHAVHLVPAIYRVICTNGMVVMKARSRIRIKHYGKIELKDLQKGIQTLSAQVEDFQNIIIESMLLEIEDNEKFWDELKKRFQFNKDEILKIQEYVELEDNNIQETAYGVGNGISAYANDFLNSDKYYELQEIAGLVYANAVI